jgi:hypothetical protein
MILRLYIKNSHSNLIMKFLKEIRNLLMLIRSLWLCFLVYLKIDQCSLILMIQQKNSYPKVMVNLKMGSKQL